MDWLSAGGRNYLDRAQKEDGLRVCTRLGKVQAGEGEGRPMQRADGILPAWSAQLQYGKRPADAFPLQ